MDKKPRLGSDPLEWIRERENLKRHYGNLETKELLKAVTIDKGNYESIAIEVMNEELQRRGISDEAKTEFERDWKEDSLIYVGMDIGMAPRCPNCHSYNLDDRTKWFPLIGPLIGLILGSLIGRYRCRDCGWRGWVP
jgi:hypothetical protein